MNLDLRIVPYQDADGWDEFIAQHPFGSIFHTSQMVRSYESTNGFHPLAIAAVNSRGEILAILVSVRVLTLGGWAGSLAARAILFAEPIYRDDADGREAVLTLIRHHDSFMSKRTLFAEARPLYECEKGFDSLNSCGYRRLGYLNYESDLSKGEDAVWKSFHRNCRNNILRGQKRGVVVRQVDPLDCLDDIYEILKFTYAHSKIPLSDRSLFESVFRQISRDHYQVFAADYEGRMVACGLFLSYRDRVTYWYGGALRISGLNSVSVLLWDAMKHFLHQGSTVFDFAGAGWEGEDYGPGKFKSQFGGNLTNYGRYRKIYSPWKMWLAESGYKFMRNVLAPKVKNTETLVVGSSDSKE
ncbi:MAG: aminoacyltransferase [Pirellula sp.]|jgi:hypothetical protein|nr:aminoacyltransferase [Pirellula sp.]